MLCADGNSINTEHKIPQPQLPDLKEKKILNYVKVKQKQINWRSRNTDLTSENPASPLFLEFSLYISLYRFLVFHSSTMSENTLVHGKSPSLLDSCCLANCDEIRPLAAHPEPLAYVSQSWPPFYLPLKSHPLVSKAWHRASGGRKKALEAGRGFHYINRNATVGNHRWPLSHHLAASCSL